MDMIGMINVMLWAVILHELGHLLAFKLLGMNVMLHFGFVPDGFVDLVVGCQEDYDVLTGRQIFWVNMLGILCGLLPILLVMGVHWQVWAIMLSMYFIGCHTDLKNLWEVVKNGRRTRFGF